MLPGPRGRREAGQAGRGGWSGPAAAAGLLLACASGVPECRRRGAPGREGFAASGGTCPVNGRTLSGQEPSLSLYAAFFLWRRDAAPLQHASGSNLTFAISSMLLASSTFLMCVWSRNDPASWTQYFARVWDKTVRSLVWHSEQHYLNKSLNISPLRKGQEGIKETYVLSVYHGPQSTPTTRKTSTMDPRLLKPLHV